MAGRVGRREWLALGKETRIQGITDTDVLHRKASLVNVGSPLFPDMAQTNRRLFGWKVVKRVNELNDFFLDVTGTQEWKGCLAVRNRLPRRAEHIEFLIAGRVSFPV
jgi:hypothetical protein